MAEKLRSDGQDLLRRAARDLLRVLDGVAAFLWLRPAMNDSLHRGKQASRLTVPAGGHPITISRATQSSAGER
jgi:hypothetical protein